MQDYFGSLALFSYLYAMNYKELYEKLLSQSDALLQTISTLQNSLAAQTITIESLTDKITQLESLLLKKDQKTEKLANQLNGLTKIALPKKVEKRKYVDNTLKNTTPAPTPEERGNNGAKRKVYNNLVEIIDEVDPTHPEFLAQRENAKLKFYSEVIRYEYKPSQLIKHIYRCNKYQIGDKLYEAKAPITPLLNSNYDSSVMAFLMQHRFIYGLPVERIVRMCEEIGMDIPKPTAHKLISRGAEILDKLQPVLQSAILSNEYLHFDETYHTILDKEASGGSRKGYLWVVLSQKQRLINYFIDNEASRRKKVFTNYLPKKYKGAIQADGYGPYKVLDGWDYPKAMRLGCVQHCKRKFLEVEGDKTALEIIDLYNKFYRIRKEFKEEHWVDESTKVITILESRLRDIERDKDNITNTKLNAAVAYALNELEAIRNIINHTKYDLDNNSIERPMRYISISRRNSMFCGSVAGAKRMAMIYSLAISCRLNNVNSLAYFTDVLNRLAEVELTNTDVDLRSLLPDKWA